MNDLGEDSGTVIDEEAGAVEHGGGEEERNSDKRPVDRKTGSTIEPGDATSSSLGRRTRGGDATSSSLGSGNATSSSLGARTQAGNATSSSMGTQM